MTGNSYFYRKLHSLLGVIPVGAFLVEHLITNYAAFNGGEQGHVKFLESVEFLHDLPLVLFLEIFLIWLPLLYHGVYGLYVAFQSNSNTSRYGFFRNWMFTLQRITGVLTLIFVVWHFYETRLQIAFGNVEQMEIGIRMHEILTHPLYFWIYVVGVVAASFHFANGMWSFLVSWGITIGPRAQRISSIIWMGVFVIMSVMFVLSLFAFTDVQFQSVPAVKG
jgi:succinate dehydrogenase / fumarate reductase, cytochrome b subunit